MTGLRDAIYKHAYIGQGLLYDHVPDGCKPRISVGLMFFEATGSARVPKYKCGYIWRYGNC